MSGETEAPVSGWTVDTLREHLSQRISDLDRLLSARMDDADKAITRADSASEQRFASVNEFRGALSDQQRDLLRRGEYTTAHEALIERVTALTERVVAMELRLTSRLDRGEGITSGASVQRTERRLDMGQVIAVIAVIAAIAAVVISAVHR